jgi:hypothetical protein
MSLGPFDRDATGAGRRRLLCLRTIYEFSLASHLVGLGLGPARAFANALTFSGRERDGGEKIGQDERNPETLLFDSGKTILVIHPQEESFETADHETFSTQIFVCRLAPGDDDFKLFDAIFMDGGRAAAVVYVNPILESVDTALGIRR